MGAGASSNGKALPSSTELSLFEEMDKDGSGEIDIEELIDALTEFSKKVQNDWPKEDLKKVVHFFDVNHDNKLDKAEYNEAVKELKRREADRATGGGRSKGGGAKGGTGAKGGGAGGAGGKSRKEMAEEKAAEKTKAKEAQRAARIVDAEKKRVVDQAKKDEVQSHKSKYSRKCVAAPRRQRRPPLAPGLALLSPLLPLAGRPSVRAASAAIHAHARTRTHTCTRARPHTCTPEPPASATCPVPCAGRS